MSLPRHNTPLTSTVIRNCNVQAFRHPVLGGREVGFCGGPVLTDPKLSRLRHIRAGEPQDSFRESAVYEKTIPGEFSYAGPLISHFGHTFAELIHRILPSKRAFKRKNFLFITTFDAHRMQYFEQFPEFLKSVLIFFSIHPDEITIADQDCKIEDLAISEQGSSLGTMASQEYLEMLKEYSEYRLKQLHNETLPSEKIYVVGKSKSGGQILGESYIQKLFSDAGYWIFNPEEYQASFQLYVYSRARSLVFSEGSAIHGTSILGREMIEDCAVLLRRPAISSIFHNALVGRCRNLEMIYSTIFLGTLLKARNGEPATHQGVSMYDINSLKSQLQLRGISTSPRINRDSYFDICEKDLFNYISYSLEKQANGRRPLSAYHDLLSRFESMRRNLL